jgi:hypothetical protein
MAAAEQLKLAVSNTHFIILVTMDALSLLAKVIPELVAGGVSWLLDTGCNTVYAQIHQTVLSFE